MNYQWVKHEANLWKAGKVHIAGVDEAGRGPLMGPVVTAAVILPQNDGIIKLGDSKKLTAKQREKIFLEIMDIAIAVSIYAASAKKIDKTGILKATLYSMSMSVKRLKIQPDWVLIDGNQFPEQIQIGGEAIVDGDDFCRCISAASIIAKVTRDKLMLKLAKIYPEWKFDKHKGYCTAEHERLLSKLAPTPHHRFSFEPIRQRKLGFSQEEKEPKSRSAALGQKAEQVAVEYLKHKGWEILQTNFRGSVGEIDIIGKFGKTIAFIEVKSTFSPNEWTPFTKISSRKKQRLWQTAGQWIDENKPQAEEFRFDVLYVSPKMTDEWKIEHIPSAMNEQDIFNDE